MTKIPNKVRVGSINWKVKRLKTGDPELVDGFGVLQRPQGRILIDDGQIEDSKKDTLLHEIIHAVFYMSGNVLMELEEEEKVVHLLASQLLDTLQRNPEVVDYLFGD